MTLPPGEYEVAIAFRMQNKGGQKLPVTVTVEVNRSYVKTTGGAVIPVPHDCFEVSNRNDGPRFFVSREVLLSDANLAKLSQSP